MFNYFVYESAAASMLKKSGYDKKKNGKIYGCKLMFASKERNGFIEPIIYEGEDTKDDIIYGVVYEVDDEMYRFLNEEFYGSYVEAEKEVFCDNGDIVLCYLHTMDKGVFAIPDDFVEKTMEVFYERNGIDKELISKAKDDCEREVLDLKNGVS